MDQIQKREVYDVPLNEKLPTVFYSELIEKFEAKSKAYMDQIAVLERDLKTALYAKSNPTELSPIEGILQIVRNHQFAIERLSSTILRVHHEIERMKVHCIANYGIKADVFSQDDKLDALHRRKVENQLKEALAASKPTQPAQPAQQAQSVQPHVQNPSGQAPTAQAAPATGFMTGVSNMFTSNTAPSSNITFGQPSSTALTTFNQPFPSAVSGSFGSSGPSSFGGFLGSTNSTSMPSLTSGNESLVQAKMNRKKGSLSRKY